MIRSWGFKESDYIRKRIVLIRHYFPGVDLESISDDEFAILANDAEWINSKSTSPFSF